MTWQLRKADGGRYEAAGLDELREWATQARIAPDDEVSPDGAQWRRAADIAALEMEWLATADDGEERGPFNLLSLSAAVAGGRLRPNDKLTHKRTGECARVADRLLPVLAASFVERTKEPPPAAPDAIPDSGAAATRVPGIRMPMDAWRRERPADAEEPDAEVLRQQRQADVLVRVIAARFATDHATRHLEPKPYEIVRSF